MRAKKIQPGASQQDTESEPQTPPSGHREQPLRPTRGAAGEVRWWERPAPEGSDDALWEAVRRVQARRMQLRISVQEMARRVTARGHPLRRETLSRVLNGKQPTTWDTVAVMADIVGVRLDQPSTPPDRRRSARPQRPRHRHLDWDRAANRLYELWVAEGS